MPVKEFDKYLLPDEIQTRRELGKYLVVGPPKFGSSKNFGVGYRKVTGMYQVLTRTKEGVPSTEVYYPEYMIAGDRTFVNSLLGSINRPVPSVFFDASNPGEKIERRGSRRREVEVHLTDLHNYLTAVRKHNQETRKASSRVSSRVSSVASQVSSPGL